MKTRMITALAALLALAAACAVDDETILKITGFRATGDTGDTAVVSVLSVKLLDKKDVFADIGVTNFAAGGGAFTGTGVYVTRVLVGYSFRDAVLPSYSFRVSTYVPAPSSASTTGGTVSEEAWIKAIPLVPAELKEDLAALAAPPFTVQAQITVEGRTDDGRSISVSGWLPINFS